MSARSQGVEPFSSIHLVMAVTAAETAVSVDIDGADELFECPTAMVLDAEGRVHLDESDHAVRGVLSAVGDPRGLALADGRVVRAEDVLAGFVHTLTGMMAELYSLPADARCTLLHPATMPADAVAALRDALDYVGLTDCTLAPATSTYPVDAVRAAAAHRTVRPTSTSSDKAFAAMVSDSATGTTHRPRTHRRTPTRAAVAVAALVLAFLAVGGAVGTRDLDSSSVAPLNSQQAITPSAPVVTSSLESTTTSAAPLPVQEQATVEVQEAPAPVDTPDPILPPASSLAAVEPDTGLGLPTDRFPFAPPDIDIPDFPSFPEVTVPTPPTVVSTPATTTAGSTTTGTTTTSGVPSVAIPRLGPMRSVNRP